MINIVIPMAGEGKRFKKEGYTKPKPFIEIYDEPMISRVLDNLYIPGSKFYLLVKAEHLKSEDQLFNHLKEKYDITVIPIEFDTEGTASTVLFARKYINNDHPLIVANCDQLIDFDIQTFYEDAVARELDGSILTFEESENDPKWSYVQINAEKEVLRVKEKEVISNYASVGIYLFMSGQIFVNSAIDMIIHKDRTNNEFYLCPTYNYMIKKGYKIGIYNIDFKKMYGLGKPEDLQSSMRRLKSNRSLLHRSIFTV